MSLPKITLFFLIFEVRDDFSDSSDGGDFGEEDYSAHRYRKPADYRR